MIIRKITQYIGGDGERIEVLEPIDSDTLAPLTDAQRANLPNEETEVVFLGLVIIPVGVNDTSGQMIDVRPQELRFPIEADSIGEAFSKFNAAAETAMADLKKRSEERMQQRDSGLVVPNAAESEAINKMKLFIPE